MLRLAAGALLAAVLIWSVMFLDLLSKRTEAGVAATQHPSQVPSGGRSAQAPAPVTSRTS